MVFLFAWYYFSSAILSYLVSLFTLIPLMLLASIWFLKKDQNQDPALSRTRFVLGLLSASFVLPLIVEIYLTIKFG